MGIGWTGCVGQADWKLFQGLMDYHANHEPPNLEENETLYRLPPEKGVLIKLLWVDQQAVGFYMLRLLGPQEDGLPLHLNVFDGAFIKKDHRRKGWGYKMLSDIVSDHPNEHLGFSHPISKSFKFGKEFVEKTLSIGINFGQSRTVGKKGTGLTYGSAEIH